MSEENVNVTIERLMVEQPPAESRYYRLLADGSIEPTDDLREVARCVGQVLKRSLVGWLEIVTFFLALDCGSGAAIEEPLVWETALEFGGHSRTLVRYSSRSMAADGHEALVVWALANQNKLYAGWVNEDSVLSALKGLYDA